MNNIQFIRQKLYYKWALVLCILALIGYSVYFLFERYIENVDFFADNLSLYLRLVLIGYFSLLLIFINKFPSYIFNLLGFIIAVPLGWMISIISFFTIGFEGITVTGFIFLILSSAIVFNFTFRSFLIAVVLIIVFHFTLLSFYHTRQPEGLLNHIFLIGLSGILGLTTNYMVNIIKRNELKALNERELLLKEIHHRVKNNLQIINSLLNLQAATIAEFSTKAIVLESQSRVKSMALIHQLLYESENLTSIDFPKYLSQLIQSIKETFSTPDKDILLKIKSEKINLDIDKAIPIGLITNELITNSFKYAFKDKKEGHLEIEFKETSKGNFLLRISDDGIGLPKNFDFDNAETLGLKLVRLLCIQIEGEINVSVKSGTEFTIRFSEAQKA